MKQKKKDKQKKSNMLRKVRTKKGKMKKGKMTRGKMMRGKMTRGKMTRGKMASSNKRKFGTDLANVPLAEIRDKDSSRTITMEYSKITLDTIQLPDYVMRSTNFPIAVEDYVIDHYSFLTRIPGSNPIVDAYDDINECYVDIKVTTRLATGRSILTSEGQMNYLADEENVGYYLIVRKTGKEAGKNMYLVELLLAVHQDSYDDDRRDQYAHKLKKAIKESKSTSR